MALLSYSAITNYPFQPFSKIYSSDINSMFSTILTWANGNINSANVAVHGLTRTGSSSNIAAGTANYVVINDANGDFSEEAQLALSRGGTGLNVVAASQTAGDVLQINPSLTGFSLGVPTAVPASLKVFQYSQYS